MENNINKNEIEIDLKEMYVYLKSNVRFIGKVTVCIVFCTIIYNFFIVQSIYGYQALIQLPKTVNAGQLNNFAAILQDDIKPKEWLEDDVNRITNVVILEKSSVIKVFFEGESPEKVREFGDKYVNDSVKKINKIIVDDEKMQFSKEIFSMVKSDFEYISSKLRESTFTNNDAVERLNYLFSRIETKEQNQMFLEAEQVKTSYIPLKPLRPNKVKNIISSFVVGILVSFGYLIVKFIVKKL